MTSSDTACECGCHLSDGMYNHDATEPCPSCHNTANEKAREILNKLCEMGCCDRELDDPVCDDRQAEYLAAALREYGEAEKVQERERVSQHLYGYYQQEIKQADAEGYRRGIEESIEAMWSCLDDLPTADYSVHALEEGEKKIRALLPSAGKGERHE